VKPVVVPGLRYPRLWMAVGLALAAVIAVLSLVPNQELPDLKVSDKIEHLLAYVALGFCFASVVVRRDWFWLALALLAFGALIEVAQGVMSLGRSAELKDLLADAAGIGIGFVLALTPLGGWARWLEAQILRVRA
jgi:VanZ family protein